VATFLIKISYCSDGHLIWLEGHIEMAVCSG